MSWGQLTIIIGSGDRSLNTDIDKGENDES